MNRSAKTHSEKYLLVSNDLYPSIVNEYEKFKSNASSDSIQIERLADKIKKALFTLKQVDINVISTVVDENILETIEDNINFMYEELLRMKNELTHQEDDEETKNAPEVKRIDLIRDKYKFLQKLLDTAETETVLKDAKRLDTLLTRINFEDLPEGEYDEMVNIKNDVSRMITTLNGIEKSEKYGPYIYQPLIDLFANVYTLGNKEKAEAKAATILNFIEDPKNIAMFEPAIKRIINKKMTTKEFRTFYESVKGMMARQKSFESFKNYTDRDEYIRFV